MPKQDSSTQLVPCFRAGSPQRGTPHEFIERGVARRLRDEGAGYFADSGRVFQLVAPLVPEPENVRESAAAIPFSKVPNPLRKPSALHYQVPACGDHRVSWLNRFMLPQVAG